MNDPRGYSPIMTGPRPRRWRLPFGPREDEQLGPRVVAGYDLDAGTVLLPPHIRRLPMKEQIEWARKGGMVLSPSVAGGAYSMFEMMQPFSNSDGATVSVTNVETVLTQDTLLALPANFFSFPGKVCWLHVMGKMSNVVTTPGNVTFRLRWNAIGGTILVASGAITPDPVAATDNLFTVDCYVKALATGQLATSLTLLAHGAVFMANSAYTLANLKAQAMPPGQTALANVASLDGTIARALTLTAQPTLTTFTLTVRDAWIVAMN